MAEDVQAAKAYLSKARNKDGLNLYDHLSAVLSKILDERPNEPVEIFEELSLAAKRERFQPQGRPLQIHEPTTRAIQAAEREESLVKAVKTISDERADGEEEEMEDAMPNIMELGHYFGEGGIGLGKEELFRIFLAIRHLAKDKPIHSVRFWGKVLGIKNDYIVAEAEPRDTDEFQEDEENPEGETATEPPAERDQSVDGDEDNGDFVPKPFKPPPVIPREELGEGSNKKIYFVCKEPGEEWVRLPLVTPAQIVAARQIKKFLAGDLDAKIISYPPFPGTEKNYLRAQIARISASTQISPAGFYQFPEAEDEGEEEEVHDTVEVNPEFEGLTPTELTSTEALGNWVHHTRFLLPQGRCEWFNIFPETENDFEDEEEDAASRNSEQPLDQPEPEVGPPLLTPLSEDTKVGGLSAWTVQLSSSLLQRYGVAIVHSNLWPGAHAFGIGRKFENIYIGYGQKYETETFSPAVPPPAQDEFQCGPATTEVADPTPEEEEKARAAKEEGGSDAEDEDGEDQDDEDD